ncbi:uncharacterized protein LAESUDRAFT_732384 [Laetiporus sulphureus 93-53]|uniref:Uncharacterized protein n=1 Tax=Laetiporus sulphureus 93-53 TaxID=1314785 RepID=A0A165B6L9_9APHY|nr:uncharacterized protein LAESUDRAFT_732384 [Laetiporus sulphureus 93-53]KZT00359.1 hypothetical protein LAESUDRAFT_732384 [Laetiporus sulphureus 93-53]
MSLPQAPKDISDHPLAGSVVQPHDKAQQAADVDRKLHLYGVIEAFRQGRMPSNAQIDSALTYAIRNSPVDLSQLSRDGQRLIQDSRDIIETARLMVKNKNEDELFQNFIWHTRDVNTDAAKKDPNEIVPIGQEKAKADGVQAVQHLRTLLSLILTNAEVRKLLADFSVIGRDLLARGAGKVAEAARPDPERLSRVDDSAPRDQFITDGGRVAGLDETPVLEARIPGTETRVSQHPKDDLGQGATVKQGNGEIKSGAQAIDEVNARKDEFVDHGTEEANRQTDETLDAVGGDPVPDNEQDAQAKKNGLMGKVRGIRDNLVDRVPQGHKDKANEHYDRAKRFLSEEYFPPERRDQFIYRGKKVIIECQNHKDYQESITWLLGFLEEYASHGKTAASQAKDSHNQMTSDNSMQQATGELRTLLERFANGMSLAVIGDAMQTLYQDAQNDQELKNWFRTCDVYAHKVLLEPGFVLEPQCNDEANQLMDTGRQFYDGKYQGHFNNLFSSLTDWFTAFGEDPLNQRFGNDWARLTKDLLFDSEGSLKFKPELWMDVRKVILPTVVDEVGYVPIPRIEYTDDAIDLVIENLALSGRNLLPNLISFEAHNFVKFSMYDAIQDEGRHEFTLTFSQIQADMRDVAFYFRKKSGFPKLSDSGIADVLLGGQGLTVTAHIASAGKDQRSVFHVKNVHVKVATLKFSIRDSKHDLLYKTLRPLATGLVKKQLQKVVADAVRTGLEYVDGQLVGVRDRMNEAKTSEDTSRTQVLQELFHRKKEEASNTKSRADEKTGQFKVVGKRESAILQNVGRPEGWANRTQERAETAAQGEGWHSEAFTVV